MELQGDARQGFSRHADSRAVSRGSSERHATIHRNAYAARARQTARADRGAPEWARDTGRSDNLAFDGKQYTHVPSLLARYLRSKSSRSGAAARDRTDGDSAQDYGGRKQSDFTGRCSEKLPRGVCLDANFALAHLYLADRPTGKLISTDVWYDTDTPRFAPFRDLSTGIVLGQSQGIPEIVLARREAVWFEEVARSQNLVVRALIEKVGIQSVFAFPVCAGNDILGILEFFGIERRPRDEKFLKLSVQIGAQIGHVMLRKRMEASLRVAKEAAEQANAAKSAFLAAMSHEILYDA